MRGAQDRRTFLRLVAGAAALALPVRGPAPAAAAGTIAPLHLVDGWLLTAADLARLGLPAGAGLIRPGPAAGAGRTRPGPR